MSTSKVLPSSVAPAKVFLITFPRTDIHIFLDSEPSISPSKVPVLPPLSFSKIDPGGVIGTADLSEDMNRLPNRRPKLPAVRVCLRKS